MIYREPATGRTASTLDLQRLTTHALERIETVRGPYSSLNASEALAGVVSLVTTSPNESALSASDSKHFQSGVNHRRNRTQPAQNRNLGHPITNQGAPAAEINEFKLVVKYAA